MYHNQPFIPGNIFVKMSPPHTPQPNANFHQNREKNKGKMNPKIKRCKEKGKTSYHLTGNPCEVLFIKELRAGKMVKNEVTGSYLILPENNPKKQKHLTRTYA